MNTLIEEHRERLSALCRQHGVARLRLFGSAASDRFDPATSDLDFVVAFSDKSPGYADRYLDFAEALERLFGRDVDARHRALCAKSILSAFREIYAATCV